jgi:hypothetical protein
VRPPPASAPLEVRTGRAAGVCRHSSRTADAFGQSVSFAAAADQAAVSRFYGGIHYRSDNEQGLVCGKSVASLVIRRAQTDGAP